MSDDLSPNVRGLLRTMRIIHAALVAGCATFAVIAVVLRAQQGGPVPEQPVVSFAGLALAAGAGLAALVVPNALAANWRQKIAQGIDPLSTSRPPETILEEGGPIPRPPSPRAAPARSVGWWQIYQTRLILTAALLEGVIFFELVAYLTEGPPWTLGVAALFFVGLVLLFPTQERVERWIRTQQELVEQQKHTAL